jgi:hypothetical protein
MHHVAAPDRAGVLGVETTALLHRVLEQAVHRRTGELVVTDATGSLQHAQDLADRALGVVTLGLKDSLLQRDGNARQVAVSARLGD